MDQLCEFDELRLLLRDQGAKPRFSDHDLQLLFDRAGSNEGAVALGWLLKAADARSDRTSRRIGQVAESYAGGGESHAMAMAQYRYWAREAGLSAYAAGMLLNAIPDEGTQVGDITRAVEIIDEAVDAGDLSRLW